MYLLPVLGCGLLGAGVVVLIVPIVLRFANEGLFLRVKELHHHHTEPVPRLGGVALALAFGSVEVLITLMFPDRRAVVPGRNIVILSSMAMFLIGCWDDFVPLGARKKLLAQIAVALWVHYCGLGVESLKVPFSERIVELHGWGVIFTVVWLVAITNLLNLIDGVDGLAGGIGLLLMVLLLYVGYQNGAFVLLTAGMTGALLAFLIFNFPPARVYLGDGGAYLVGYQIGIFSLVSSHKGTIVAALIAPLFVLALPILDASLAILRRGLCGLPLFRPDRRHIHHRLLASGMSRRRLVLFAYAITLLFLLMALVICWSRGQYIPVLFGLLVLILLTCAGRLSFSREWFAVGRTLGNSLAIRREVQYASSLGQTLQHEANRCATVEDLFAEFASAASRVGFTAVTLKLADGTRTWSADRLCARTKELKQNLLAGKAGELKLSAPECMCEHACPHGFSGSRQRANDTVCERNPNDRMFEILSDLLAEIWVRAISRYAGKICRPVSFDMAPDQNSKAVRRVRAVQARSRGAGSLNAQVGHSRQMRSTLTNETMPNDA